MVRVLVSLSQEFLKTIDTLAVSEHRTRSELIREALRNYMRKNKYINATKANDIAEKLEVLMD